MTAATGFKRLAIAVAALVVAAFATLVGLSFLIPAASVRDAIKTEIRSVTGLDPIFRGNIAVSLFPHATVTFHDVLLGDTGGTEPAVAADEMVARLRYFPLLAGRIEIADVTLIRPTINISFSADGRSNWSGLVASLAHAVEPQPPRFSSFSEIAIHDGTIVVRGPQSRHAEHLDEVEFQLAWPSISRSFAATGRLVWKDEPIDASLTLSDFRSALTGQRTGVKVRLASKPVNVGFDGGASDAPTLKMDGTLSVEAPSLRDAMRWVANSRMPFGGFGRFELRAQSDFGNGTVSLTNVNVELDGNKAEGALTLATDGHRSLHGNLTADAVNLTPYTSGIRLVTADDRGWDRLPIALEGFNDLDLDLRLSAGSIRVAGAQLGRTAAVANMRGGKLTVAIGDSQAFGGSLKGSLSLGTADGGAKISSHVQFIDVDLANCLGQIFGFHKIEGRGNLAFDLIGSGSSVWALTHTLQGTASLHAHDGSLAGMNVEQLLRRLQKRPLSGTGDFRSGRTPYDQFVASVTIDHGMVAVQDVHFNSPAVHLVINGQASVPSRDLDLEGNATLAAASSSDQFNLPFVVQGPWDDPLILPDASSLIRRSGAAAPLLEAVKRHSAGDAVRAVIDQLFAAPPETPAASPPADTAPGSAKPEASAIPNAAH